MLIDNSAELSWVLLLSMLAAGAIVDVLRKGSIFAGMRAWAEAMGAYWEDGTPPSWWRDCLSQLIGCAYCLTFHAALWCLVGMMTGVWLIQFLITWLALVRLVWLSNLLLPERARFDRMS